MKYLLLLLPALCFSQYNFTKENIDYAYNTLKHYEFESAKWKEIAYANLRDLEAVNDKVNELELELGNLLQQQERKINEYGDLRYKQGVQDQKKKRLAIGFYGGYGANLTTNQINLGGQIGIGLTYTLIRL